MSTFRSRYGLVYILLNVLTAFSLTNVISAIYMIFLLGNGLNNVQALTISAIFHLGVFVFEVPTGIVADLYGKKMSVMIGYGLWAVGQIFYVVGASFNWFVVAELTGAIGMTFISGALDAWMIEKVGEQKSGQVLAKSGFYTKMAVVAAGLIGGVAAQYLGMRVNFAIEAVVAAVAILFCFLFMEADKIHEHSKKGLELLVGSFQETWKHFTASQTAMKVAFFTTLSWFFIMPVFSFWQPNLEKGGFSTTELGIAFALFSLGMSFGSWIFASKKVRERFSAWQILAGVFVIKAIGTGGAFLFIGLNPWLGLAMLMLFEVAFGAFIPQVISLFNTGLPDKYRASLNSLLSLINKFGTASSLLLFGLFADNYGRITPWMISAIGFVIMAIIALVFSRKDSTA